MDNNIDCTDGNTARNLDPIIQGKILEDSKNVAIIQQLVGAGSDGIWGDNTSLKVGEYVREAKDRLGYSNNNADITPEFIELLKKDGIPTEVTNALSTMKENGVLDQSYNRSLSAPAANDGECSIENEYATTEVGEDIINPELLVETLDNAEPLIDAELTNIHQEFVNLGEYLNDKYDYSTLKFPEGRYGLTQEEINSQLNISPEDQKRIADLEDKLEALPEETRNNIIDGVINKPMDTDAIPEAIDNNEKPNGEMADEMARMLESEGVEISGKPSATTATKLEINTSSTDMFNTANNWMEEQGIKIANLYEDFTNATFGDNAQVKTADLTIAQNDANYEVTATPITLG